MNNHHTWYWFVTFLRFNSKLSLWTIQMPIKLCREKKTDYKRFSVRNFCGIYSSPSLLLTVEGIRLSPFPLYSSTGESTGGCRYILMPAKYLGNWSKKVINYSHFTNFSKPLRWINRRPPVCRHNNFHDAIWQTNIYNHVLFWSIPFPFPGNWSSQVLACCDLTN